MKLSKNMFLDAIPVAWLISQKKRRPCAWELAIVRASIGQMSEVLALEVAVIHSSVMNALEHIYSTEEESRLFIDIIS
jgi:hypothetical protein